MNRKKERNDFRPGLWDQLFFCQQLLQNADTEEENDGTDGGRHEQSYVAVSNADLKHPEQAGADKSANHADDDIAADSEAAFF